jgi:hypothetical protein
MEPTSKPRVSALTQPDIATRQLRAFLSDLSGFMSGNAMSRQGYGYSVDKAIADTIEAIDGKPKNGRKSKIDRIDSLVTRGKEVIAAALELDEAKLGDDKMVAYGSSVLEGGVLSGVGGSAGTNYQEGIANAGLAKQLPLKGTSLKDGLSGSESGLSQVKDL